MNTKICAHMEPGRVTIGLVAGILTFISLYQPLLTLTDRLRLTRGGARAASGEGGGLVEPVGSLGPVGRIARIAPSAIRKPLGMFYSTGMPGRSEQGGARRRVHQSHLRQALNRRVSA